MVETRELTLHDGRAARVRWASVADAARVLELDRSLAADGRGMVIDANQIRSLDQEQRRIDDVYRGISAGDATLSIVTELAEGGAIIGAADLRQLGPARCRHVGILSVGVAPSFQRLGVARAMMTFLIEHARASELVRLELYVRADNERAQALYRSLGFEREGTRARFVREADGAFVDDHVFALFLDAG